MSNFESWLVTLDRVAKEQEISRYDQLLLDAAEVQLILGNLGAASELVFKMNNYQVVKTFQNLKQVEAY
jgi:hypothetical protein